MPASYRLRLHWRKQQVPFQNDIYLLTSSSDGTLGEAIDIVGALLGSALETLLLDLVPTDVTLEAYACSSVVMNGGSATPSASAVSVTNASGSRAPAMGTGQTSNQNGPILTYFPTTLTGERARACKVFIPTLNESDGEDDVIGGSLAGAIDAFALALQAGITLSGGTANWAAGIKIAGVATIRAIAGWVTRTYVASQRRRRPPVLT